MPPEEDFFDIAPATDPNDVADDTSGAPVTEAGDPEVGTDGGEGDPTTTGEDDHITIPREKYEELLTRLAKVEATQTKPDDEPPAQEPPAMLEFWSKEELQAIADGDPSSLNKGMNKAIQLTMAGMLQKIPTIVQAMLDNKETESNLRSIFEKQHAELQTPDRQAVVMHHVGNVRAEKPNLSKLQILEEATKRAYKTLGINPPAPAGGTSTPARRNPAAQGGAGGRQGGSSGKSKTGTPDANPIKTQIDDFFDEK